MFICDGDQGLAAAREVAAALRGKTVELPGTGMTKAEFAKAVGKYLDESVTDQKAKAAGMDQLCVIFPRIDLQPKWLRDSIRKYCEFGTRPLVLLMTCADLDWTDRGTLSFLYQCRKKGAPQRTPAQREFKKLSRPKGLVQRSLLD